MIPIHYIENPKMKKVLGIIFLSLCLSDSILAQSNKIDDVKYHAYWKEGNYDSALVWAEKNLVLAEKYTSPEDTLYAGILLLKAKALSQLGQVEKAEPLFLQVVNIYKMQVGEHHPSYAASLCKLAILYRHTGKHVEAEVLLLQAIRNHSGETNPACAMLLNELTTLYRHLGKYAGYEWLYQQALEMTKSQLGVTQPAYAHSLNKLAMLYRHTGRYKEAESLMQQALEIIENQSGVHTTTYANGLHNMAMLYREMERYREAETLIQQALKIIKEQKGEEHIAYAAPLDNFAQLNYHMGRYVQAEGLYQQAIEIRKVHLGENHPAYATSLFNLALLYQKTGRYGQADSLLRQVIRIRKAYYGKNHTFYAQSIHALAVLAAQLRQDTLAFKLFVKANRIIRKNIQTYFIGLSQQEQKQYLTTLSDYFADYHHFALQYSKINPVLTTLSYDNILLLKGLLLQQSQRMRETVMANADTALQQIFRQWTSYQTQLAKLYSGSLEERSLNADSLEKLANQLEKQLMRASSVFRDYHFDLQVNWSEVQATLKAKEAAIEFIHFLLPDTTVQYAALVLRKDDAFPQMVALGKEDQLIKLLSRGNITRKEHVQQLYRGVEKPLLAMHLSDSLYQLIWQPLDSLLQDIQTLYYAPSGRLHQIAFAALPYNDSLLLSDRFVLRQVSYTRVLALPAKKDLVPASAALFGGIYYDPDTSGLMVKATGDLPSIRSANLSQNGSTSKPWLYLPATEREVRGISLLLEQQKIGARLYSGEQGSEEAFKALSHHTDAPDILHLATHGFFFIKEKVEGRKPVYYHAEDPLLRSGLIMAGANQKWRGKPLTSEQEDGILTAYEVSQMDLSGTDLVVLSGCETGLGEVSDVEGVYGLQRAFQMAGVRYLIMSLWQVPDEETRHMMMFFYQEWLQKGRSIQAAFQSARQQMRVKYEPYYWAGFVLVE